MVDVNAIGAGGGSIAWIDPAGGLRVGPHSAGSEPGPACYGRGGEGGDRHGRVDRARLPRSRLFRRRHAAAGAGACARRRSSAAGREAARPVGRGGGARHPPRRQRADGRGHPARLDPPQGYDPREFALVPLGGAGPACTPPRSRASSGSDRSSCRAIRACCPPPGLLVGADRARGVGRLPAALSTSSALPDVEAALAELDAALRRADGAGARRGRRTCESATSPTSATSASRITSRCRFSVGRRSRPRSSREGFRPPTTGSSATPPTRRPQVVNLRAIHRAGRRHDRRRRRREPQRRREARKGTRAASSSPATRAASTRRSTIASALAPASRLRGPGDPRTGRHHDARRPGWRSGVLDGGNVLLPRDGAEGAMNMPQKHRSDHPRGGPQQARGHRQRDGARPS